MLRQSVMRARRFTASERATCIAVTAVFTLAVMRLERIVSVKAGMPMPSTSAATATVYISSTNVKPRWYFMQASLRNGPSRASMRVTDSVG